MKSDFWTGFFNALDFDVKNVEELQGASGIRHKILCAGVDESKKRLVIVQDEHDARILSMVQADVQANIKNYNVLMVRPVSINLGIAFSSVGLLLGTNKFTNEDLADFSQKDDENNIGQLGKEKLEKIINTVSPQIEIIQKTKPNLVSVFQEIVHQLSHLKFLQNIEENTNFSLDFHEILTFNPVVYDNNLGICPIPLYLFSIDEAESFFKIKNIEFNKMILKKHGIYQFFYPPIDSLALGLIDNNSYDSKDLLTQIDKIPSYGHPFGENELTEIKQLNHVVDALKEKGLVVEGEFSLGITENGIDKRMLVKFSPRESIFKRLANIISVKVDINLNDLFK
ncbi:hypothetical protein [Flavobacterium sp. 7A]|uniref:hypothetical protein n=1 Tax=Flavobacterium sp. 7A TaxID=2940571 RepID=UPI002227DFFA|nr:hypothetical protein [Flavobacterium sp. 7A]MCW2119045.1 hypothetical protein [Flavobacterium sp. 7A]